jgi:aminopeptidase
MDERWTRLAEILVGYSTRTQPGERVLIMMMEVETLPLVEAVYAAAVRAGAYPHVQFASAYLERALLRHGDQTQLDWVPEPEAQGMEWADVYIGLRGARNPHEFSDIPSNRLAAHRRAMGKVSAMRTERTRWVLVRVPNEAFAQQAEVAVDQMIEFFFRATLRDWETEAREYRRLAERFQVAGAVRIVGAGTDLRFSTHGRRYVVGEGGHNMPDGEIFTAPVDNSVEGHIYFEFPGVYSGRRIENIRLEFRAGEVVQATASANESLLHELLTMDAGARRVGEFGVGTNFGIDRFCYDILYDEKIGGTIHLALGRAYRECGGTNQSALHWDIVKDLRQEGVVYLDGEPVLESGRFRT